MWASFISFEIEQLTTIFHLAARSNFDAHCVYDRGISGDASSFPNHKPYKNYMERRITLGGFLESVLGIMRFSWSISALLVLMPRLDRTIFGNSSPQPGLMMFMWNMCRLQKYNGATILQSLLHPQLHQLAVVLVLEALKQLAKEINGKGDSAVVCYPMLICVNTFIGLSHTSGERSCLGSWGPSGV